jgi:L-seryl-tRNA(Ser) seleniumtransferase
VTLRDVPSVHEVLDRLSPAVRALPHTLVVTEVRHALDDLRDSIRGGGNPAYSVETAVEAALDAWRQPSIRHVINATGVILHTNLGRAPAAPFTPATGYSNLEYDIATGRRGKRDVHTSRLLEAILGKPAVIVNNNAAAVFLTLNELAMGGEAVVSRGELIEIGDGFRIPEIMKRSLTELREVGTTNRTSIADYREAITPRTRVLLRVHPSNFHNSGFTARPSLEELVALGREHSIPVYEDLGSGALVDLSASGVHEPLARASLAAGVNLISFSGDKLLGGPQAGIIAGDAELVTRVRRNPLYRALRQDKLFCQAMETTLRHILFEEYDQIPALRMIRLTQAEIGARAEALAARIGSTVAIGEGESIIGGGSTPDLTLPTALLTVLKPNASAEERRLRALDPPILTRIENDRVRLDLRTVFPAEEEDIARALAEAFQG